MIATALLAAVLTADKLPRVQAVVASASWCSPCKFQKQDCEKLKEFLRVGDEVTAHIRFVDGDKDPAFVTAHKVEVYPETLIFVDGKEVHRFKGQTSALRILAVMHREQAKLLEGGK